MDSLENIEDNLESIEYLSRSPSRLKVLKAIQEKPRSRRTLREMTDVSRVTLSRMLDTFEDRGWVKRTNGEFKLTSEGSYVASELARLVGNFNTLNELDGAMEWLPVEEFDFDLACLSDAEVTTSDWRDHTAQIRRTADVIHGSERIVGTASGMSRDVVEALWETTMNDDASFEAIYDSMAIDIARSDKELRQQHRDMIDLENTEFFRYEGDEEPIPMVMVCDDYVILCGYDESAPPPGTLETTNPTVRSWAESFFEEVRAESIPIDPDVFRS